MTEARLPAQRITHAAALVPDIEASIRFLQDVLGWGPWSVYGLLPPRLDQRVYRGESGAFGMLGAETHVGDVDFALNQSLVGPSIYTEFVERRGYGLHHLACMSSAGAHDLQNRFASAGVGVAMGGRIDQTIEFMYFDSEQTLGIAIESGTGHAITLRPDRQHHVLDSDLGEPAIFAEVAIVVRDLAASVDSFSTLLGWGPWNESDDYQDVQLLNGDASSQPVQLRRRLARASVGPLEVQLVQPVSGPSPEQAALDAFGEGLHHIGCVLAGDARDRIHGLLQAYDVRRTITGRQNGREFWYLDALPRMKLIFND